MRFTFLLLSLGILIANIFGQDRTFSVIGLYGNDTKAYSKELAIFCCKMSCYIYEGNENKNKLSSYCKKHNFSIAKHQESKNSKLDLQYLVANRTILVKKQPYNLVLIVFRGTQEKADWLADAMIIPHNFGEGMFVHTGFYKYTEAFKKDEEKIIIQDEANHRQLSLKELIDSPKNTIFLITGHSLGGAIATLYSVRLLERNIRAQTYTFGAPGIGDKAFVEKYNQTFTLHRIVNQYDIVPESTMLDYAICNAVNIKNNKLLEHATELALKVSLWGIKEQAIVKKYMFFHIGTKHTYGYISQKKLNAEILLGLHSIENYVKNLEK